MCAYVCEYLSARTWPYVSKYTHGIKWIYNKSESSACANIC